MSTKAYELTQILETLTEEDYRAAIKYAEFLAASRKKKHTDDRQRNTKITKRR